MIRTALSHRALFRFVALSFACMVAIPSAHAQAELLITEINFHPDETGDPANGNEGQKFIEIKNVGDEPALMSNLPVAGRFSVDGIGTVTYTQGTINPGGFLVIASSSAAFAGEYGFAPGATFAGGLSGKGEKLEIFFGPDASKEVVFEVSYWDGGDPANDMLVEQLERQLWPSNPDEDLLGYTLVPFRPDDSRDPDDYRNWRPSISASGGSPAADEPNTEPLEIFINEVRTRDATDPNATNDAVELFNPNATPVNISNWFLTDNLDDPKRFPLSGGTTVPANGYLVLENGVNGFVLSLSSRRERVFLYSADAGGNLTGFVTGLFFEGAADGGVTFSRYINSVGAEQFPASPISLGSANSAPAVGPVVITEIMYEPTLSGSIDEYIEIKNISGQPVQLYDSGSNLNWRIEGVSYRLPGFQPTLPAGGVALITPTTAAAFRLAHPGIPAGVQIFGPWTTGSGLSNGGEEVALQRYEILTGESAAAPAAGDIDGRRIINVDVVLYDNNSPWPLEADGRGRSLVRVDPTAYGNDPANWQPSLLIGGSPGVVYDYSGAEILVNEVLSHSDVPLVDVIELYNPTGSEVAIGGWYLTDDKDAPTRFKIPAGTTIPARGFWAVNQDNDGFEVNGAPANYFGNAFQISSQGDSVWLYAADGAGELTGYRHGFQFRATENGSDADGGLTLGRYVDSFGREHLTTQERSFEVNRSIPNPAGDTNNPPVVGPVVFTEINFEPAVGETEFIELKNISEGTVNLFDDSARGDPSNNWALDGVTFTFPNSRRTLPAGSSVIILPQNADAAAFRAANSLPPEPEVYVIGGVDGYAGALNNAGEELVLLKPDAPDAALVPMFVIDLVNYGDSDLWPTAGAGVTLEKINLAGFSDDPINWRASPASGGSPGATSEVLTYDLWAFENFTPAERAQAGLTDCEGDVNGDGFANLYAYAFGYDPHITPAGDLLPSGAIINDSGPNYLAITFRRQPTAADLTYSIETSTDLGSWSEDPGDQVGPVLDNGDGTETVQIRTAEPSDGEARRYLRVRITKQ